VAGLATASAKAAWSFFAKSCMGFILKPWIIYKTLMRFLTGRNTKAAINDNLTADTVIWLKFK
jgi:hypothetical protein